MTSHKRNITYVLIGLGWILLGIALMIWQENLLYYLSTFIGLLLAFQAGVKFMTTLLVGGDFDSHRHRLFSFLLTLLIFILALAIIHYQETSANMIMFFIGGYQLLMGLASFISFLILVKHRAKRRLSRLLFALINMIFGLISLFVPMSRMNILFWLGIYNIFIGITYLNDGRELIIPEAKSQALKRNIRFPVPIIWSILLPNKMANRINEILSQGLFQDEDFIQSYQQSIDSLDDQADILQIMIHTSNKSLDLVGHVNIAYKGIVYSYGNHDVDSRKLFQAIGDGVLFKIDRDQSLRFAMANDVTIFEYDVVLNDHQKQALEAKLADLEAQIIPWEPTSPNQVKAYGGRLKRATGAQSYKFKSGKFKTYYVFGTNCVLLSDEIIGTSGLDLFLWVGILTPGTYYDYLEKEYQKEHSIVVNRRIYSPDLVALLETEEETP